MCLSYFRQDLFNEQTFDASPEFEGVFELLLNARDFVNGSGSQKACTETEEKDLAEQLQHRMVANKQRLMNLPRHESYSRHVIGVHNEWVAYICRWEKGVTSCVHGHPWFAYYQVIDGVLDMDFYERCESPCSESSELEPVRLVQSRRMNPGDVVWRSGEPHQYDNLIHRVGTGNHPGFTLHLSSENPALGEHYRVAS